uniref:Peptidase S1 domain-containing protein n=1 Tax=Steinernema glaseri TaxID=37863 RepID=A0A1I8AUH5_9BILA
MVAVQSYAFMGIVSEAESQQTDRQGRVITKITVHPDYNPTTLHADIAVLEWTALEMLRLGIYIKWRRWASAISKIFDVLCRFQEVGSIAPYNSAVKT